MTLVLASLAAALVPRALDASVLSLGERLGGGSFGSVHWGQYGGVPVVAKTAIPSVERAVAYLETEAFINTHLWADESDNEHLRGHLAEFLGCCKQGDSTQLVWRACGESSTLLEYIEDWQEGRLARDLGCDAEQLPEVLLQQLLTVVAVCHAKGVVHRDVKPENVLVDRTTRTLRLIDFGSACEMGGWLSRRGYQSERGPCSVLYCAPEQLLDADLKAMLLDANRARASTHSSTRGIRRSVRCWTSWTRRRGRRMSRRCTRPVSRQRRSRCAAHLARLRRA